MLTASKLNMYTPLTKIEANIYLVLLIVSMILWGIMIIGYVAIQLYIHPLELIMTTIAFWALYLFKTYLVLNMVSSLPKLEEVF